MPYGLLATPSQVIYRLAQHVRAGKRVDASRIDRDLQCSANTNQQFLALRSSFEKRAQREISPMKNGQHCLSAI